MTIEREKSKYLLYCDFCCSSSEFFETFDDAVDYKKDNGWKSRKEGEISQKQGIQHKNTQVSINDWGHLKETGRLAG
ncbi:MAG: hypothetical protein HPY66_1704 [Firmicutes bacterium]|nr:hypothetical protein [Bacillota bacterium]